MKRLENGERVLISRLKAAEVLGKPLPKGAEVHHANGDIDDNRNENLVLCQDRAYHWLLHQRMRAHEATGLAHYRKCKYCQNWDDPKNLFVLSRYAYHRACQNKYRREGNANYLRRLKRQRDREKRGGAPQSPSN